VTSTSRLYAILVTKDDADVIVEVVRHAATFCDKIIQLDNCSTDGTWELMGELEAEDPDRFVRLRQFDEPFYDGIRAEVYNSYRQELGDGWWMMLAPDEMMDRDPRPLLADAAASGDDAVICWMAQFVFTSRDRRAWESGLVDPTAPVTRRVRSYRVDWREPRFFRNDPEAAWDDLDLYLPRPDSAWSIHRRRPVLRHYQFRSPDQIQHRLDLRRGRFRHVTAQSWTEEVKPRWKYSTYRDRPIHTTGVWHYARRLRQMIDTRLGRRSAGSGVKRSS
jgi:hypothetical protein